MKYLIVLILSFSAFADVSLDDAFRREKSFLLAQKESLLKMKNSMSSSLVQRKSKAEKEISGKQLELSRYLLKNQELHEEFKSIEKMTKESSQMSGQLEKNQLKINENLQLIRAKLGLSAKKSDESGVVQKFESSLSEGLSLVQSLSTEKWRTQAFLDENEHLVQGEVLFHGLFSAYGKIGDKVYALVPYNAEFLKVFAPASSNEIYLFSPSFEKSNLKASQSWKESVADAIPGIVMAIIMMAVLGLFILLARA